MSMIYEQGLSFLKEQWLKVASDPKRLCRFGLFVCKKSLKLPKYPECGGSPLHPVPTYTCSGDTVALFRPLCWFIFVNVTQTRNTWEEGPSAEELPPLERQVGGV